MNNKGYKLYEAMRDIDDDLILEAERKNPFARGAMVGNAIRSKWAAVAASVVIMAMASLFVPGIISQAAWEDKTLLSRGEQDVALEPCNIQKKGIAGLVDILRGYVYLPEKLNITYFSARLSPKGIITEFDLQVYGFDSVGVYQGTHSFKYSYTDKKMSYTPPDPFQTASLQVLFNPNYDISYVSAQQMRLPLEQQMKRLNFGHYFLQFRSLAKMEADKPVIDGSQNAEIPVLTLEEYRSGMGGRSIGKLALYFTLSDGLSGVGPDSVFLTTMNGVNGIGPNAIAYALPSL